MKARFAALIAAAAFAAAPAALAQVDYSQRPATENGWYPDHGAEDGAADYYADETPAAPKSGGGWYPVPKRAPGPVSSPDAAPRLSGAPDVRYDTSAAKVVKLRTRPQPGIKLIRGGQVSTAQPSAGAALAGPPPVKAPPKAQMKLVRIGPAPETAVTRYGTVIVHDPDAFRSKPRTIRVNP